MLPARWDDSLPRAKQTAWAFVPAVEPGQSQRKRGFPGLSVWWANARLTRLAGDRPRWVLMLRSAALFLAGEAFCAGARNRDPFKGENAAFVFFCQIAQANLPANVSGTPLKTL